jgi:hypothetical protein
LNKAPVKVRPVEAMLQDHGWTALASAIKMKTISTHGNQLSGGRIETEIANLVRALINDSPYRKQENQGRLGQERVTK